MSFRIGQILNVFVVFILIALAITGLTLILIDPIYGLIILAASWILLFLYQRASFYPHNLESLPKDRLYVVADKDRSDGKFLFKLRELYGNGHLGNSWTLVHNENIYETCFRIDKERGFVPIRS